MTALAKLGRFARLSWLMDLGLMCLIVGGFMAATGAMFWTFTRAPEQPAQVIQQAASGARPEMICECTLQTDGSGVN